MGGLLLAVLLALPRLLPHAPLKARLPLSTLVLDASGRPLRITLASDAQYRLFTPLKDLPPALVEAVLLHEDQYFYWHPGVNPVALLRAASRTALGQHRQGASTITMQLARLLDGRNTRQVDGKLRQIFAALALELRYSKAEILEAYLNAAPYGGNVSGAGAAARLIFNKMPAQLDLAECLALAVLPQAPQARASRAGERESLRAARARLFARWLRLHPDAARQQALVAAPLRFAPQSLPFFAPHFTTAALADPALPRNGGEIHTTLDLRLQELLERRLHEQLASRAAVGIGNADVLLVDLRDMGVKALIGSANYFDAGIQGQVDGTAARRSPGSTLKPLLYALAMDQGLIHPLTVLKDAPTHFGAYAPENADGGFLGPITAHDALIRSRNVPAVSLAARLANPTLYRFLKNAGVALPMSERHYGLALTLGGGEVTMQELVGLYAMLGNRGVLSPLRFLQSTPVAQNGTRLLSEEASFMVLDMLKDNPRPDDASYRPARSKLTPAWKTGTSWGFRDAWTVGLFGPYVLGVWVGNFDGSSNPALVGIKTAAPIFFALADAIATANPGLQELAFKSPPNLARVQVCAASGALPNADCPERVSTWYIPGKSPIALSTVHRRVRVDVRSEATACADTPPQYVREEVFEYWPSDVMRLYAQAGIPRRQPPPPGRCSAQPAVPAGKPPQIVSPLSGVSYAMRADELGHKTLPLQAHAEGGTGALYWFADGAYLGSSAPGATLAYTPKRAGRISLLVSDEHGAQDSRELNITLAE